MPSLVNESKFTASCGFVQRGVNNKNFQMLAMNEPPLVSFMVLVATEMTQGNNTLK